MTDEFVEVNLDGETLGPAVSGDVIGIICIRITDLAEPYAPASRVSCSECAADVWLTEGAESRQVASGAVVICRQCFARRATPGDQFITSKRAVEMAEELERGR